MFDEPTTRRDALQRVSATVFALTGGASLLAACGAESSTTSDAAYRVGILTDLDTLNPMNTVADQSVQWLVYDKLMVYDARLRPALSLAKSRDISADGKTITYTLNDGAKFTDGEPLTSEDVKFTFELVKDTQLSFAAPYMKDLVGVDASDPTVAVVTYSKPPADDPAVMTAILPKHLWGGKSKADIIKYPDTEMVGSGPFKLVAWKKNQSWEIERNPDYWGEAPQLATISWVVYQNPETMALALKHGEIDAVYPLSATIWTGLKGAADIDAKSFPSETFDHFGMNVYDSPKSKGNPLLKDKVVRQALNLSIDRDKLVELVLEGLGLRGTTIIMPALTDYHLDIPESSQLNNDPERAKQMLEDAGYTDRDGDGIREAPNGEPLHFRLFTSTIFDRLRKSAELVIPMAKEIGVKLDLTVMDDPALVDKVFTEFDFDTFVWVWTSPPNPTFMLSVESNTTFGVLSDVYYSNPEYEKLYQAQTVETDFQKRQALVHQAQQIFYDDAAYAVLYYPSVLLANRTDKLTGWLPIPGGYVQNFTTANYLNLEPV